MSAKRLTSFIIGLSWLAAANGHAAGQPQGNLIELHSCEVYAGGCTVSSEATLGGRFLLQVWDVTSGSWQGVDLSGLRVAVLETANENLAAARAQADQTVVYLPEAAGAGQRTALLAWLKSRDAQLAASSIQTRVVPVSLGSSTKGVTFSAGKFVNFLAASLGDCESRVCGEDLWYEPSTPTSRFTVALNTGSQVTEPLLKLKWNDNG